MTEQPINDDGFTEDQLWERLEGQIGSERASTLIDLGFFAFKIEDFERALSLADAAIEAAKDSDNDQVLAQAHRARSVSLNNLSKYEEAAASMKDACAILQRFDSLDDLCDSYMHVSWNLESAELFEQALVYAEHAERVATECENWNILGRAHWQKADLFMHLDRKAEILEQLSLCRQAWRKAENVLGVLDVDDRVADRFIDESDYKPAVNLLRDCLDVSSSLKDAPDKAPYFSFALARALRFDGQPAEARKRLELPLQYNIDLGRMQHLAATYRELAHCAYDLGEIDEAFALLDKARAHYDVVGSDGLVMDCDQTKSIWLHGAERFAEAAAINRSLMERSDGWRAFMARARLADNLRCNGDFAAAVEFSEPQETDHEHVGKSGWFWRECIRAMILVGLDRNEQAWTIAEHCLNMDSIGETSNFVRGTFHELRGDCDSAQGSEDTARAEWAHAVALYLASGCHDDATRLSRLFLAAGPEESAN